MSPEDYASDLAPEAAGNWRKFESFGWHTRRELDNPEHFGIFYTTNRDAGLAATSNTETIKKLIEDEGLDPETIWYEEHNHWGHGWVGGFVVRVYEPDGETLTPAWVAYCGWMAAIEEYGCLDSENHSQREYDAAIEAIEQRGRNCSDDAPEDWANQVFSWLWKNDQQALESDDDQGPCPTYEQVDAALEALGWLEKEDNE